MSSRYQYGDHILDAFKLHKKPLNLTEIVNYIAIVMQKPKDEITEPIQETLAAALSLGFLVLDNEDYRLPDASDEEEPAGQLT